MADGTDTVRGDEEPSPPVGFDDPEPEPEQEHDTTAADEKAPRVVKDTK